METESFVFSLFSLALAIGGCSLVVKSDVQCDTTMDCEARGAEFAGSVCEHHSCVRPTNSLEPRWSCVGEVTWPEAESKQVTFVVEVVEMLSLKPPEGLAVKACAKLDITCTAPMSPPVTPGSDSKIRLDLPSGFDGYLEMTSFTTVPSYLYIVEPLVESRAHPIAVQLLTPATVGLLTAMAGIAADPERGTLVVLARDCSKTAAPGLSFTAEPTDAKVSFFYVSSGLPTHAKQTTDDTGSGGFVNLSPGVVEVRAALTKSAVPVSKVSVTMRAGGVTYVDLPPTP
jgi:hypothetical protein